MIRKLQVRSNMIWNVVGLSVETATGFIVLPFLVLHLGVETYGVWLVLGALTMYLGLLELGVRMSIGRHIALHCANGNTIALNQTFTGGFTLLLFAGALAFAVLTFCEPVFFRFYHVPEANQHIISVTYRLMGCSIIIVLIGGAFDAALWGLQRFDWLNGIDTLAVLLRTGLTFALVRTSDDIIILAYISITMWTVSGLSKAITAFYVNPQLRLNFRYLDLSTLRQLLSYGSWNLIRSLAYLSRSQLGPILIGSILGLAVVPAYAIATRLVTAVATAMAAITGALIPYATVLHATSATDSQHRLLLVGGRYTAAIGTCLIVYLLFMGGPLIMLWVGPSFSAAVSLLTILLVGEWLPNTQQVTSGIILAKAQHRPLALYAISEALGICILAVVFMPSFGIIGAGIALAFAATVTRGVFPMIQGCRLMQVSLSSYLLRTIIPPILSGSVPGLLIWLATCFYSIGTWLEFLVFSMIYFCCFGICFACLIGREQVVLLLQYFYRSKSMVDSKSAAIVDCHPNSSGSWDLNRENSSLDSGRQ